MKQKSDSADALNESIALDRRTFIQGSLAMLAAPSILRGLAAEERQTGSLPSLTHGVQSALIDSNSAMVWGRSDRPAKMIVEWDTTPAFHRARRVVGPLVIPDDDLTGKTILAGLPEGQTIFYRVRFKDADGVSEGPPIAGRFKVPSREPAPVTLIWGGDTAGQGFGINEKFGGMKLYSVMERHEPDLFIHSGDGIYADHPILPELKLPDGSVWRNLVTEEKSKVAETLREFRGNWRYNFLDNNLRSFNSSVAQFVQWDDHETTNNWDPYKVLTDARYTEKRCDVLSGRARKAFQEYAPVWVSQEDSTRIYTSMKYGPGIEMFKLDARSYRGANSPNNQQKPGAATAFFGLRQLDWLKASLLKSTSTWKVVLCDMPLGLIIKDGERNFEGVAQGNGPAEGRELEIANLLRFIKRNTIQNVVWLTADVHYAAAHYFDPSKAQFTDFNPFWEFVAGPIHAGAYPPGQLDSTIGPQLKFCSTSEKTVPSTAPGPDSQFFGKVKFDPKSMSLMVSIHSLGDKKLYEVELPPHQA